MRALGLGIVLALACASPGPDSSSARPPGDEAAAPRPMGRAALPRSGHLTYELQSVERVGSETQVDLLIRNGTSRNFESIVVRVIALGPAGERVFTDSPLGVMSRRTSRRRRVYFPDLAFAVDEILVEVVYTYP